MMTFPRKVAIVGVGKIARDQHFPAISQNPEFELAATASRNAQIGGIDSYESLADLLDARTDIDCVSLCTPPMVRYADARRALLAGRHVMLEKPPGATLSEVHDLIELARTRNLCLFATWHSRYAASVAATCDWLKGKAIQRVDIVWKEDVRRWHPDQEWIWQAGGLGIFDPGINALSVLTAIYPRRLHLAKAQLFFPSNRDTPIAADLSFSDVEGTQVSAEFDWRQEGPQTWDIAIVTDKGEGILSDGGARLTIDEIETSSGPDQEYSGLYSKFAELVASNKTDVDLSPLVHVADAFILGRRTVVEPFNW